MGFESTLVGSCCIEELPAYTVTLIRNFLDSRKLLPQAARHTSNDLGEKRLTPAEYEFPQHDHPGTGILSWRDSECGAQR